MESPLSGLLVEKGRKIYTVSSLETICNAVKKMNASRVGALLVVDQKKLVGMFTERDVLKKVIGQEKDPQTTKIADVMSTDVITVNVDTTVQEAMMIVTEKRFRHLPVLEGDDIIGMISSGDLTHWLTRHQEIKIKDLENYISGDR